MRGRTAVASKETMEVASKDRRAVGGIGKGAVRGVEQKRYCIRMAVGVESHSFAQLHAEHRKVGAESTVQYLGRKRRDWHDRRNGIKGRGDLATTWQSKVGYQKQI